VSNTIAVPTVGVLQMLDEKLALTITSDFMIIYYMHTIKCYML